MNNPRKVGRAVLGLVCLTSDALPKEQRISFRTITRTSLLKLTWSQRLKKVAAIYDDNIEMLHRAIEFCMVNRIGMYRMSSAMFPFADWGESKAFHHLLSTRQKDLRTIGLKAQDAELRLVAHPDQFCVLSTDSPDVLTNTIRTLNHHAWVMDAMGLSQTPYNALNLHGGKRDRASNLVRSIKALPLPVRSRLTLENCEYGYSVADLLPIYEQTGTPILMDFHHELISEQYTNYDCLPMWNSYFKARQTWETQNWVLTHLSNGIDGLSDRRHSDFIVNFPRVAEQAPWCEIEAKGKEQAIFRLENWEVKSSG